MLGGIEAATSKAFTGGLDKATLEESTADEIRAIKATDYISTGSGSKKYYDPLADEDGWVVDFTGVAKGFFSYRVPTQFSIDKEEDVKLYCSVVRNFLNYVLAHGVCPEYTLDVMAAREVCNLAENELFAVKKLGYILPGDFNVAASTLYGGRYENYHISAQTWDARTNEPDTLVSLGGMTVSDAERVFKTAIAFEGDNIMFDKVMAEDVKIIRTENRYFEVLRVHRATEDSVKQYASVKNVAGEAGSIKALGVMVVKAWEGPGFQDDDLAEGEAKVALDAGEERFWIEDSTLELVFTGLKMDVVVHELDIGIKFIDSIEGLYCSFFTYLPNEKISLWKEPGKSLHIEMKNLR
jgi:hypothetical protein